MRCLCGSVVKRPVHFNDTDFFGPFLLYIFTPFCVSFIGTQPCSLPSTSPQPLHALAAELSGCCREHMACKSENAYYLGP